MFQAFVLAAGLGTRLRPLTEWVPKPLVPVCGVPLLAYSLALAARHGLRSVVVNAHWLAPQVEAWAGEREGCFVTVITEPELLGTGGGLAQVAEHMASRFVVLNADVLHGFDLSALLSATPEGGAAMALRSDPDAARYGIVAADAEDCVVELTNVARAEARGPVDRTTHFTGIHALDRQALSLVPPGPQCIVRTAYRQLVPQRRVAGVRVSGMWLDAGDPAAYLDANLAVLRLADRGGLGLDPFGRAGFARTVSGEEYGDRGLVEGVTLSGPVWIGAGAEIRRGAVISDSVVGAGALIPANARLSEVVVWEKARVVAGDHRRTTLLT